MSNVRIGVIGSGGIGKRYADSIVTSRIGNCELTAVCNRRGEGFGNYPKAKGFTDSKELIRSGKVDAVIIATPHFSHTDIGIDALSNGLHVLVEKPVSVHKADCERLIAAHTDKNLVFAALFNQRTDPHYEEIRSLVSNCGLGELIRVNWISTDWYRTEKYFASGGWRATWRGEGGGVLLNQCSHHLDLLQWMCGMPNRVSGFCKFGSRHDIEVEDQATAHFEYPNGATGVFVTSTGEYPGTNRLEIAGERGKILLEGNVLSFAHSEISISEFSKKAKGGLDKPEIDNVDIPIDGVGGQHEEIIQNFVDAIVDGVSLIAPGEEGIRSLELSNAILYSSLTNQVVDLPIDGAAFEKELQKLIAGSRANR